MVCDVTASVLVVQVATRAATGLPTQVAMLIPQSLKVTVRVGAGAPGVIVAVKVTDWPQTVGLVPAVRVVVETESAWPVMPVNSASTTAAGAALSRPRMGRPPRAPLSTDIW